MAKFVTIEKGLGPERRIAVVRFDRGDGINALSPEALRQLTQAARSFEDDGETSVVVLAGHPKAFSAGFDLKDAEGRSRRTMDLGVGFPCRHIEYDRRHCANNVLRPQRPKLGSAAVARSLCRQ